MRVGGKDFVKIVVGGAEKESVVGIRCFGGDTFFIGHCALRRRGGARIRHVDERGDASAHCGGAFRGHRSLMRKSRFTEMNMRVNRAGEQHTSLYIDAIVGSGKFFVRRSSITGFRYQFAVYYYIAVTAGAFVDYLGVVNNCPAHCSPVYLGYFLNQLPVLSLMTPNTASENMPELILLVPSTRFTKMMGTSFMRNPHFMAVNFISI